jgi:hypothetical protein
MSLEDMSFEARDQLAELAKSLADNPKTRKQFLRLTKEVKPDLPVPELEIEDHTNAAIEMMRKENESLRNKMAEKDAMEALDKKRQSLIRKGLAQTDEDIEQIEKVMLENKIADHEAAAKYWEYMRQSEAPTPSVFNTNVVKNQNWDLSKFAKNPIQTARNVAAEALQELRKSKPIGF